jgi:hypothetical protein
VIELKHRIECVVKRNPGQEDLAFLETCARHVVAEARHHGWWPAGPGWESPIAKLNSETNDVTIAVEWPVRVS